MAKKIDFKVPYIDLTKFVPRNLKNPVIGSLLENLFNKFMSHDESVPFFGYVGKTPSVINDFTPKITQETVARDINAIQPVFNFSSGTDTQVFTFNDLMKKASTIGIGADNHDWLYTESHNYAPPIDFDKFANYFNYYWVAKCLPTPPSLLWNPNNLPEYYVIAKPSKDSFDKANVDACSTAPVVLTGTGYKNQKFELKFSSALDYTLTALGELPFGAQAIVSGTLPEIVDVSKTSDDTISFDITQNGSIISLLSFRIIREPGYTTEGTPYAQTVDAGDTFTFDVTFFAKTVPVVFSGTHGVKYKISNVVAYSTFQTIDGVKLFDGARVLVKDNSSNQNGIYVTRKHDWVRAEDYDGALIMEGARTWVKEAADKNSNGGKLFISSTNNTWATSLSSLDNTNDWQDGNFWVHVSELGKYELSTAAVQAVRPIIEYHNNISLSESINNVTFAPDNISATSYNRPQRKYLFNQIPLFDLYRYDGTHSGIVSSIFYYVEDKSADLDIPLQRRVKLTNTSSHDFVFEHGLVDNLGHSLFYKIGTNLKSIWNPGYRTSTLVDISFDGTKKGKISDVAISQSADVRTWVLTALSTTTFSVSATGLGYIGDAVVGVPFVHTEVLFRVDDGTYPFSIGDVLSFIVTEKHTVRLIDAIGEKGMISNATPFANAQQQVWTLTAMGAGKAPISKFIVSSSKFGELPLEHITATVGVPYDNGYISFIIQDGTLPFSAGDVFNIRVGNRETPRYSYRDVDGNITDVLGGPASDTTGIGAYQVPRSFVNNPYNDSGDELPEGTLYSHFRSILQNQPLNANKDLSFGGSIKGWGAQHTLFASLLMQKDFSPISIIDKAERMYAAGLASIADIFKQNILQYFCDNGHIGTEATAAEDTKIDNLVDAILNIRKNDIDVKTVLFDSTSGVTGIPVTLAQIGASPLVNPSIVQNTVLRLTMLQHHDGHQTPLVNDSNDFRYSIWNKELSAEVEVLSDVLIDGALTKKVVKKKAIGSFNKTEPAAPFNGQCWFRPGNLSNDILIYENGIWHKIDLADTLNRIMLNVERRLFDNVNTGTQHLQFDSYLDDEAFVSNLKIEFSKYASNNGLTTNSTDYRSSNSFTWNYSNADISTFPSLAASNVPARWADILLAHQRTVDGVIPTVAPHLEPWKLFGFATYSSWWSQLTQQKKNAYTPIAAPTDIANGNFTGIGTVKVIKTEYGLTAKNGYTIDGLAPTDLNRRYIDGVHLNTGDKVLLLNEPSSADNGVWTVRAGLWDRPLSAYSKNDVIKVSEGEKWVGTTWVSTADCFAIDTDPIQFAQARQWTFELWADLAAAKPSLRTSVNPFNDALLPPFVTLSSASSAYALTSVYPSGTSQGYNFGTNGPIEAFWKSTSEYQYSLVRCLLKTDPLAFIKHLWGFTWVDIDGVSFDMFDMNLVGHKRLYHHGEPISAMPRTSYLTIGDVVCDSDMTIKLRYDGYYYADDGSYQLFTVRDSHGNYLATISEGMPNIVNANGLYISNLRIDDEGRPFRYGDTISIVFNKQGLVSYNIVQATQKAILGFGQVFSNVLRSLSIDSGTSYANDAFRNWDINMGYCAGGLISTDNLKVSTSDTPLIPSSYKVLLKKNEISKDLWLQALRVTASKIGSAVQLSDNIYVPVGTADDWEFLIEGYNPRQPKLSFYNLDTSLEYATFSVLDRSSTALDWKLFNTVKKEQPVITTELPFKILGLQNLITFITGYQKFLEDAGWIFDSGESGNTDLITGRIKGWQLEIEKTIEWCYTGVSNNVGHVINPFADKFWVRHDTGLLAEFTTPQIFDVDMHTGLYDMLGVKIKADDIFSIRKNIVSEVTASVPIFSAHVQIDEYEHLIMFNNFIEESTETGLLYDAFSGARAATFKFNGQIQGSSTFRPDFGGHYLIGNSVRKNIQASTDDMQNFYDPDRVFENSTSTPHALALLGFSKKDYFTDIGISDKSQFNFWRGMIQSKGTNLAVQAFLNSRRFEDASIDEYWAYKVATYGDARPRSYPELKLYVSDTPRQFTSFQFDAPSTRHISGFTQIDMSDESRWVSSDETSDLFFKSEPIGAMQYTVTAESEIISLPFIADHVTFDVHPVGHYVDLATTSPIVRNGPQEIDGVYATLGHIVLVKNQDKSSDNGVYIVQDAQWTYAPFANSISKLNNLVLNVKYGTANKKRWFIQTNDITTNKDSVLFSTLDIDVTVNQLNARDVLITRNLNTAATIKIDFVGYGPAPARYNPAKLFNYAQDQLVEDIPIWHPAAGHHNPLAMESINVISSQNPARFNKSTQVVNNNAYDPLRPWGTNEVGRTWLNTTNLEYTAYYDRFVFKNRQERLSRWGALADYASIDVYEWVQSPVPPDRYEALAIAQIGSDTDVSLRASGAAAMEETYSRTRTWQARPIAWSRAGVPSSTAHPSFLGSFAQNLSIDGDVVSLEDGLFADLGIEPDMRIGAWEPDISLPKPISEYIITSKFTKSVSILDGQPQDNLVEDFFDILLEVFKYTALTGTLSFEYEYTQPTTQQVNADGNNIGYLHETYLICTSDTGAFEKILLDAILSPSQTCVVGYSQNEAKYAEFSTLGLRIRTIIKTAGDYAVETVPAAISATFSSRFKIKDAVYVVPVVDAPDEYRTEEIMTLTNDPTDPIYLKNITTITGATAFEYAKVCATNNIKLFGINTIDGVDVSIGDIVLAAAQTDTTKNGLYIVKSSEWAPIGFDINVTLISISEGVQNYQKYYFGSVSSSNKIAFVEVKSIGWRAWSIPTQDELALDSKQPDSSWKPYFGDFVNIVGSIAQVQDAIAYSKAPLILNNGTTIERYNTVWGDWSVLKNTEHRTSAAVNGPLEISHTSILDPLMTSVYINGTSQFNTAYSLSGNKVVIDYVSSGAAVVVIVRKYEPTVSELAFDPTAKDDLAIQTQYKKDFEYVEAAVRDINGSITGTTYFFWVKNKTTAAKDKSQSVQAIAQSLRSGPTCYLTFQMLDDMLYSTKHASYGYDAISIAGLTNIVSRDATYKVRFIKDFVLRDDPEELNRKDVHTEWALIRVGQRTKIPEPLWVKLTDSICGFDAAGNSVPSLNRTLYDERNSSSTRFGFKKDQTLAPSELLIESVKLAIVNTTLRNKSVPALEDGTYPIDFIECLDFNNQDGWFKTPELCRNTMSSIWNSATPAQVNSLFFAALEDILANNYELTDIFKTSRLSASSVKVVNSAPAKITYE